MRMQEISNGTFTISGWRKLRESCVKLHKQRQQHLVGCASRRRVFASQRTVIAVKQSVILRSSHTSTRRRALPVGRHRGSTSPTLCLVTVADSSPHAAIHRRWPSFPGRRFQDLERSPAARHVSTVIGHLSQAPEDSSLQALLSVTSFPCCRAWEVTFDISDTLIVLFTYLLTYMVACVCC